MIYILLSWLFKLIRYYKNTVAFCTRTPTFQYVTEEKKNDYVRMYLSCSSEKYLRGIHWISIIIIELDIFRKIGMWESFTQHVIDMVNRGRNSHSQQPRHRRRRKISRCPTESESTRIFLITRHGIGKLIFNIRSQNTRT